MERVIRLRMSGVGRLVGLGCIVGLVASLAGLLVPGVKVDPLMWLGGLWKLVGVALIGLLPLTIWLVVLAVKHWRQDHPAHAKELLDYEYISCSAPTWGLLGTIIALVMAGAVMAERMKSGASTDTVLGIIPMVAQALFSTVVGLIVQWIADTALHVIERKKL